MKRALVIKFKDGSEKELILSKAAMIKIPRGRMELDQLPDGTWRLLWNEGLIDDFSQVDNFEIRREE